MKIGWIGTGNMGNPMAAHVQAAGHELTVHDLRRDAAANLLEQGATWAGSPAEAAQGQEVIFMSLPMPQDVQAVCLGDDGVLQSVSAETIVADLSTNALSMVQELHEVFKDRKGVTFMDIPVSGGVIGAVRRDLCIMAGGDEAAYWTIKPVLDAFGDKVMYCGPIGSGTICKLSHQLFGTMLSQVVAEALTLGVKAGVPLETVAEAISKSAAGKNPPLQAWINGTVDRNFEADPMTFYLHLARKDVRLACEMGREVGVPMDMANIAEQRMIEAMNRGWGHKKSSIVRLIQEERAGVTL